MTMRTVKEIKGTLTATKGRVLVWKSSKEAGVSIAVPGDRAVMSTQEARELATWLTSAADAADLREAAPSSAYRNATLRNLAGESRTAPKTAPRSPWTY